MAKLIISADDFGKSATANNNILKLVKAGKIQRVSVFVDRKPINPDQIKTLKDSNIKIDIHLDPHLRKGDNFSAFYRIAHFIFSHLTGKIRLSKIQTDWEEQIKNFTKIFGRVPDGLNSHEHVHFFPLYLKIALKLCKKYEIKYIRFGKKGVLGHNVISIILSKLNLLGRKQLISSGINSSEYLALDFPKNPQDNTEIVCHPEKE